MSEEKNIYTLKLHETLQEVGGFIIMRVAGGWIYDCWDCEKDMFKTGIFIPFHNEFMMEKPVKQN